LIIIIIICIIMVKLKKMEKKIIENDVKTDELTIKIEDRSELLKKKNSH